MSSSIKNALQILRDGAVTPLAFAKALWPSSEKWAKGEPTMSRAAACYLGRLAKRGLVDRDEVGYKLTEQGRVEASN